MAFIILQQIIVMAIYMLIGFLLFRGGKITDEGSRSLANMLTWIVIPSTIINSFLIEFSTKKLAEFGISFLLGALTIFIAAVIGTLLFHGSGIEMFAVTFSNCGFIGIPLIRAAIGDEGIFYLVGLLVTFNILQWICEFTVLREGRWIPKKTASPKSGGAAGGKRGKGSWKRFLANPMLIASLTGLLIFVLHLGTRIPNALRSCVGGVAALNTPLAMIVLGVYLAESDLLTLFTTKKLYLVSAVRLILVPAVTILIFSLLPLDNRIKMTMIIAGSAPVGANVAVYSQISDGDYLYACKTVTQSTLFSVLIMPFMIQFASMLMPI